jgi:hypothetical protein
VDRPKNDPGAQTIRIGLQRMYDLTRAWDAFAPGVPPPFPIPPFAFTV